MNSSSLSEYKDHYTCNELTYTKLNTSDCRCTKYATHRYSAKWPCPDSGKGSCDFGKGYPETLQSIVKKYMVCVERERTRALEIMKKLKKHACNSGKIPCHVTTTNIPRIRCSLCHDITCHKVDDDVGGGGGDKCHCKDRSISESEALANKLNEAKEQPRLPQHITQPPRCRPVVTWELESSECGPHGSLLMFDKDERMKREQADVRVIQQQLLHLHRQQLQSSQKLLEIKKQQHQASFLLPQRDEFMEDVKQRLEPPPQTLKENIVSLQKELLKTDPSQLEYHMLQQKIMQMVQDDVERCRVKIQPNKLKDLVVRRFGRTCHEDQKMKFAKTCHRCTQLMGEQDLLRKLECSQMDEPTPFCNDIFAQRRAENQEQLEVHLYNDHKNQQTVRYIGRNREEDNLETPMVIKNQKFQGGVYRDTEETCCLSDSPRPPYLHQHIKGCQVKPQELRQNLPCHCNAATEAQRQLQLQEQTCSQCNPHFNVAREYSRRKQREAYRGCSQYIPDDDSFVNFLMTAPDIHKLRYMEGNYMTRDDWYTVS